MRLFVLSFVMSLCVPWFAAAGDTGVVPSASVTGLVLPAGPSICATNATHRLDCTAVHLVSSNVDLDALVGQNVKVFGHVSPLSTPGCVLFDVVSRTPPPATLEMCGTPALGCPVRWKVCPPGLSQFWLFASLSPGFAPLHPFKGSWLLGSPAPLVASGFMDLACAQLDVSIPGDISLIGVEVWMQSARKPFGTNEAFQFTNAICFQILPALAVPCIQPGC